jgi:DNA-binding protein HU-beta
MNKEELVSAVAAKTGTTKKSSEEMLRAVLDTIRDAVRDGDKVTLLGFGSFILMERSERKGRNPKTGTEITIPRRKMPRFIPSKDFKELVE